MLNKTQVCIPDIYSDDRIPQDLYRPTFVKSLVMTPVRREQPIAAIGTYWATQHNPTNDEMLLLQTLADVTAVALQRLESTSLLQRQIMTSDTLNQFRKDLLSHLTHDLRNSVIGLHRVTEQLGVNQNVIAPEMLLGVLHKSTKEMMEILGKIIDLDQHMMRDDLAISKVSLPELVQRVQLHFAEEIAAVGLTLSVDFDTSQAGQRFLVAGNVEWLQRLLVNLLTNAIQFTPGGGSITVRLAAENSNAVLSISDTGGGISDDIKQDIFNRFWHGDQHSRYYLGRGFGLYVCKRIVEAHDGQITCHSVPGQGTTFTVTLPLIQSP